MTYISVHFFHLGFRMKSQVDNYSVPRYQHPKLSGSLKRVKNRGPTPNACEALPHLGLMVLYLLCNQSRMIFL